MLPDYILAARRGFLLEAFRCASSGDREGAKSALERRNALFYPYFADGEDWYDYRLPARGEIPAEMISAGEQLTEKESELLEALVESIMRR